MLRPFVPLVACCCACAKVETGQTFEPTTPNNSFVSWSSKSSATILDPFAQLFQHCWSHALAWHIVSNVLKVIPFPRCTAGSNIAWSCCIYLHTTANTDAATPNIPSHLPFVDTYPHLRFLSCDPLPVCHLGIIVIIYIGKSIYYQIYGIICPGFVRGLISLFRWFYQSLTKPFFCSY